MRRRRGTVLLLLVAAVIVPQGCGGEGGTVASGEAGPTFGSSPQRLMVETSALNGDHSLEKIPLRYRCSDSAIWFPLEWGSVPEATDEIVVAITARTLYRKGKAVSSELYTEWVIGGIPPGVHALYPGQLPPGVFLTGHNVITANCPPRSQETGFVLTVNALPEGRQLQNFEAINLKTIKALEARALASGSVLAAYGDW
jgi:phosphatidylethanolamine-binding protein (PEBP) family uncharacterized protein